MKEKANILLILFIIVILFSGCAITSPTNSPTATQSPPTPPIEIKVEFPNGAPSLNQEAELNCIIKAPAISLENVKIEIRLPEALKLVSGSLTWSGNISERDEFKAIDATVRSIKTGNWSIELRKSMNPQKQNSFSFYADWQAAIYISISENSAIWSSRNPPWLESTSSVPVQPGSTGNIPVTSPPPPGTSISP